ncbi:hypothetical protein Mapa_011236 [Marchantia paleacea]|nr:hypothetical protein Mapa_011236 [Marchantia paleacea]
MTHEGGGGGMSANHPVITAWICTEPAADRHRTLGQVTGLKREEERREGPNFRTVQQI